MPIDNTLQILPQSSMSNASLQAALTDDAAFLGLYNQTIDASQRAQIMRVLLGLVIWRRQIELKQQGRTLEEWITELSDAGVVSRDTVFRYKSEAKSLTLRLFATGRFFNDLRIDTPDASEPDAKFFRDTLLPAIDLSIFDEEEQVQRLAHAHQELQLELNLKGGSKPTLFKVDKKHLALWLERFSPKHVGKTFEQLPKRLQQEYKETGSKWDPRSPEEIMEEGRAQVKDIAERLCEDFMTEVIGSGRAFNLDREDWVEVHRMVEQIYTQTRRLADKEVQP